VAFDGDGGRFASTVSVPLAASSGWQTVAFPITAADLTSVGGFDVKSALAGASQLWIISAAGPSFMGDAIGAQLHVDNVIAVPEPSRSFLLSSGIALMFLLPRTRSVLADLPPREARR
jgi:hypothetical protein